MQLLTVIYFLLGLSLVCFGNSQTNNDAHSIQEKNVINFEFDEERIEAAYSLLGRMDALEYIFIVQEDTNDIDELMKYIWERNLASVMINNVDDTGYSDKWMSSLRSAMKPLEVRVVFLLLDDKDVLDIFSKIRQENLESEFVNWIIISKNQITKMLMKVLREGSQTIVAEKTNGSKQSYVIGKSYMTLSNQVSFDFVGEISCSVTCKVSAPSSTLLIEPLSERYRNFGGRELGVGVIDNWPFISYKTMADGKLVADSGIDFNILELLASSLNFTYIVKEPSDLLWGNVLADGTTTGMIGLASRREVHLCINEITITGSREKAVDFSTPYYMEPTTILSQAPQRIQSTWQAFSPFTLEVWILLVIATAIAGPVLTLAHQLTPSKEVEDFVELMKNYFFEAFRIIAHQDSLMKIKSWPGKIILVSWFLFSFIIYVFYSTTLIAVLAVPSMEKPVDSLSDVLKAHAERDIQVIINVGSSVEGLFKQATSGIYEEIWSVFNPAIGGVVSRDDGINHVFAGEGMFINARLHSEILSTKFGRDKFYLARQTFYPQSYGVACPSGAAYRIIFNEILQRLTESGLILKWTDDIIREAPSRFSSTSESKSDDASDTIANQSKGPGALSLENLQGAFIVLVIGFAICAISLAAEILFKTVIK